MDKSIKYALIAGIVLISLAVSYYLVVFLPQESKRKFEAENTRLEEQKKEEKTKQLAEEFEKSNNLTLLNTCIDDAYKLYKENWDSHVKLYPQYNGSLPQDVAETLNKDHKDHRDECYRKYPQK